MTDREKELAVNNLKEKLVIGVNKLVLNSVSNEPIEVGVRYSFRFGPYYKSFDCDIDLVKKVEKYLKGFIHKDYGIKKGKLKGDQVIFDYDDKVPALEDVKEVKDILNYCCKLAYIDIDLKTYVDEIMCDAGHGMGEDQRYDTNEFSCRYWGEGRAWHNPTEYEDWDWEELKPEYCKALGKAVDKFNKKYKLNAYFSAGEKNWIYLNIR